MFYWVILNVINNDFENDRGETGERKNRPYVEQSMNIDEKTAGNSS